MTNPADEELDALDKKLASQIGDDVQTIFDHEQLFKQARSAITALRAQLAEIEVEAYLWKQRALHQNEVANREGERADQADATRAKVRAEAMREAVAWFKPIEDAAGDAGLQERREGLRDAAQSILARADEIEKGES